MEKLYDPHGSTWHSVQLQRPCGSSVESLRVLLMCWGLDQSSLDLHETGFMSLVNKTQYFILLTCLHIILDSCLLPRPPTFQQQMVTLP